MTRGVARVVIVGIGVVLAPGVAAAAPAQAPTQEQTIQGEVVDPAMYLKEGQHGSTVSSQTYEAVDGGQTLAILDRATGDLYLLLAENSGDDPSGVVYDYINQPVVVKGRVYERGGMRGMVVTSAEPVEAPKGPEAATKRPGEPSEPEGGN